MRKNTKPVFEEIRRNVAGIDLAWRGDHYVCGPRRDDGVRDIASFGTTTPDLYKMLNWLKERNVVSVALESTSVYWIPTAEILESNGIEVVLVDARVVRMVPGRKSDVKDCEWLQQLHSCGLLQGALRPPEAIAAVRSILREKETIIVMRKQSIQQMQKCLDQMNIRVHHAVADITGKTGTEIIKAILRGERNPVVLATLRDPLCKKSEAEIADHLTGTWREEHLFNLGQAFKTFQFLSESIKEFELKASEMFASLTSTTDDPNEPPPSLSNEKSEKTKKKTAKEREKVVEKANLSKIMNFDLTIVPGVGYDTAALIVSELGRRFDSFPSEKHFVSYIGLSPSLGKSAGKNVPIRKRCKNTSRVGRALRMAAASLTRSNSAMGAFFRNTARRTDKKTAVKSTARRLAQIIYRGVRYGKEYIDCGAEKYDALLREKAVKGINKMISKYNINMLELKINVQKP